ncbi:polysaccharide biosynthesis protein [Listeria booriae]|uniref:polysaccharide biosynthesis protein n=1 Tax=Listeria booriae TaxID=1552123 RepID=UPI0016289FC4|nr:nucleoside-diphosphate sugar epimerase/dehydratase [Listeria booriae]MBC2324681.1 polysaccharide biosynthesis protein [Listeria booriae]
MFNEKNKQSPNSSQRVLIVGAGVAGIIVAKNLREQFEKFQVIAFLDDNKKKHQQYIVDIPVIGEIEHLEAFIKARAIDLVILAVPSLEANRKTALIQKCKKLSVNIHVVESIDDITFQNIVETKDVTMEQLLGREPILLDQQQVMSQIQGSTVLVTGAGGSIGSEICRQIGKLQPEMLVVLGHGENSIYAIHKELTEQFGNAIQIKPVIADIQDTTRIDEIMEKFKPNVVYHAAAHKHVPLMELNPREAVKNNILGTKNVALAAARCNVESFILISSDKAVNPNNVMGATKRVAEMVIQMVASETENNFSIVRFGNVLGSRGSVIPLFKEQIQNGGPVTVTHPDMTRYFMTIPEAAGLVIQSGGIQQGSKIFVLDMGEPIKITTLAKNLITMSGFTLDDISIEFTGVRPGDKLYEELLNEGEIYPNQVIPKVHIGRPTNFSTKQITRFIEEFKDMEDELLVQTLYNLVGKKIPILIRNEVNAHESLVRS